ncbi:MAG: Stp1/IreP family PP2C-type Ser/Thr phosphatase [Proteobacteria bacterium]|nr:Stp1/IreP family PP2C-type Ser/Thr phosphatase [Pseudomonadota bacterium]
MILRAAACTDVGLRRRVNEDRYALAPDLGLYLLADGMGGHSAGQVASQLAAEASLRAIETLQGGRVSPTERLRHAVSCANREIYSQAQSQPELGGMGTTLVALLAADGRIALAHVGDSRAYLIRRGRIRLLTDDHSLVGELLRRREISEDAAREHPHRHVLTRALGVRRNVEPDLAEMSPLAGDLFVMCSDGLTNHVRDDEIAARVREGVDLQESCDGLVELANRRGGEDNTTVVVVRYEKEDEEQTDV